MFSTSPTTPCRCPVCGASQTWSSQCRRCGADLTLLHRVAKAAEAARQRCLSHFAQGETAAALQQARQLTELCADDNSRRLLAVCHLANNHFAAAAKLAQTD